MKNRVAAFVAIVAVVVASVTTAVAVTLAGGDEGWADHRDGMMSSRSDRDQAPGRMMPGGMAAMMHGMRVGSEYAYLAEMVAHHEEAVTAAEQLQRSDRAEMREFGEAIIASQSAQIAQMQQWLADWYPTRSGRVAYEPMMRDLTELAGEELDRTFLQDMLRHHMSAVMMSQQLLMRDVADHEEVAALAEAIRDEQHAEVFQMQEWLREWFGAE